jgi:hypothetical protein
VICVSQLGKGIIDRSVLSLSSLAVQIDVNTGVGLAVSTGEGNELICAWCNIPTVGNLDLSTFRVELLFYK